MRISILTVEVSTDQVDSIIASVGEERTLSPRNIVIRQLPCSLGFVELVAEPYDRGVIVVSLHKTPFEKCHQKQEQLRQGETNSLIEAVASPYTGH